MSLNIKILILVMCSAGILIIYYAHYSEKQELAFQQIIEIPTIPPDKQKETNLSLHYVISSSQCKMLDPHPWDKSIQKYLTKPRPLTCSTLPPLTYINQLENSTYILSIQKKHFKRYKINANYTIKCCYSIVTRINQNPQRYNSSADDSIRLSDCEFFEDSLVLPKHAEFILTRCQKYQRGHKAGSQIYENIHAVVPDLSEIDSKLRIKLQKNEDFTEKNIDQDSTPNSQRLNVLIVGIDSVSKLNFKRIMPKTASYMQQNNWVQLNGYNKIGDNTFPNLMGILSGETMDSLSYWWKNTSMKMDNCPFLWKNFGAKGYVSLYAEDTPTISTFNFMRTGFVEKPTDYYLRPFMLAAHEHLHTKMLNGLPVCTGPKLVLDHIFDYAKSFFKTFSTINHFTLLWSNSLSHNDLNAPKILDSSVHTFLTDLSHLGIYDNSIVLLLSDHGVRFGNIRETLIGYIEERQPFIFIWVPKWFRETHPQKYANLLINQNRLTTPYDIHVTLKSILQLVKNNDSFQNPQEEQPDNDTMAISKACPKCTGLFQVQPLERSCQDAHIDLNWCLCSEFRHLDTRDQATVDVAAFMYDYIVNRTQYLINQSNVKSGVCSKWRLVKIYRSQEVIEQARTQQYLSGNQVNDGRRTFVVIIELNPGHTKFEATIQAHIGAGNVTYEFLEYPKRLDGIYKTSKCVKNPKLKYYCYCTKQ